MKTTIEEINDEIYEGLLEDLKERKRIEKRADFLNALEDFVRTRMYQAPLTNQQMLATISAEEFYDKIMWLLHDYGKSFTNSRLAIIEWLNSEVEE